MTNDNTSSGTLVEIRRQFKQNGQVIPTRNVTVGGQSYDSVTDQFCSEQKKETGNPNDFAKRGGLKQMGDAMARGMVLVMSLWYHSTTVRASMCVSHSLLIEHGVFVLSFFYPCHIDKSLWHNTH